MSEIEEPPAKVLKIDNIDGVTRVTEVQGLPDNLIEGGMMVEEAGITEGGGDLDQGEGHEEWLSEEILTDDDYNPASQGDGDQTDSQLGTSHDEENIEDSTEHRHDEENIEDSTEHLDTTAESKSNMAELENETNTAESEVNTTESGANKSESGGNLDESDGIVSTKYVIESQTYTQMFDLKIKPKPMESTANITGSKANITGSKANITGSKPNITESKTNIKESKANNTEIKANITETKANFKESVANNVSQANKNSNVQERDSKICLEQNIEETMKHLDGSKEDESKQDPFDSLLIKKVDVKNEKKVKSEVKPEQDGNDTDDLLRMLGEDDGKTKKKLTKTVKDIRAAVKSGNASSDDDDDFVYEGSTVKKVKAAKQALAKKQPKKAEPEDMGDGDDENDMSADESKTMLKMFGMKTRAKSQTVKMQNKPVTPVRTPQVVVQRLPKSIKNTVRVVQKPPNTVLQVKVPQKQYQNKRLTQSGAKPKPAVTVKPPFVQPVEIKRESTPVKQPEVKKTESPKPSTVKTAESFKPSTVKFKPSTVSFKPSTVSFKPSTVSFKPSTVQFKPTVQKTVGSKPAERLKEHHEIIDEEEFLDEDEFDLDENEFGESDLDMSKHRQRIMKPEMMDEEIPSDGDSHSDDGSLYDELPSSDSDDFEDWFQIDIRAEKAGDYIPLLGTKAKELLLEEKHRVSVRLETLKQSHSAFCENAKKQAEQLKQATIALAELDDMLKAS